MTTTKPQKLRIALFAITAGLLLAIVLLVFTGMHFWKERKYFYVVFDKSVYGLQHGADVFFNGVRVGKVDNISIVPSDIRNVRVDIHVDASTPVHTDTHAVLQLAGITGLKVIDLRDGTSQTPLLASNSKIEQGQTLIDTLEEKGMKIVDETSELMHRANSIVAQAENVVTNLTALTDPSQMGELIAQTKATAAHLAIASASLRGLVEDNRADLKASIASIELAARRTAELVDNGQIRAAVADLRQASRSFKELARDVRQKPSRLLFSSPAPDRKLP